ncbi:hypothetical protein KAW18_12365, partial [candidate division WOR-3 bacterium]|nr:hypothetical protein [candidate division WOR-3 bacterium]
MGRIKTTVKKAKNKSVSWLHVKRNLIFSYVALIALIVLFGYSLFSRERGLIYFSGGAFFIIIIFSIIISLHPRAFEVKGLGFLFRGFYGEPETTFKGVYGDKEMEGIT